MILSDNVIPRADVIKRAVRIGAEIRNVKLSGDLPEQTIASINGLLLEHKVIFFRGQLHLDDAEQESFAIRFGELTPHPTLGAIKGTASIIELDSTRAGSRADLWHTDGTFVDAYPKIAVLRGIVMPPFGGDTVWSNTASAYLDLAPPLQGLADRLWAVHSRPLTTQYLPASASSTRSTWTKSSLKQSIGLSIPLCACTRRLANARSCSALWCKTSLACRNTMARSCSICFSLISLRSKTLCVGVGGMVM